MTQDPNNGFNYYLGQTWIYPTNYPIRNYQKSIVNEALFKNTMVCLPTGLGKTFIAAVVMYNYYRWFPFDKVIFMATTKPLVSQQIDACYKIVGIPKNTTAELTGNILKQNRQPIWATKRVFFVTPQVLLNDLDSISELGMKIKCVVVDEAHRARGNHAYCEVIRKLSSIHSNFRVLALTASPASSVSDLITMCNTLLISHIEVRSESSPDVIPFVHSKQIETVVIPLTGKLEEIINRYKLILDKYVRILVNYNVLQSNFNSLHKGRLFYLSKQYEERNTHNRSTSEYKLVKKVLGTCTILYHAQDLLTRHGMRSFLTFYQENIEKPLLHGCTDEIKELMTEISEHVGPDLICDKLPNGSSIKLPPNCLFGHPKFYKLREILREHFSTNDTNSKVIVFCEYRESVAEANAILMQEEDIKPKMFMGQSSISQRQQLQIMDSFHKGVSNTLISTCIAEEGIDVGFVDLVICFDVSNKSSLRLIQRMGRTGRTRKGRVVFLVTQGREEQMLKQSLTESKYVTSSLLQFKGLRDKLYPHSPRLVPPEVTPECNEIFIATEEASSKQSLIKNWCRKPSESSNSSTPLPDSYLSTDFIPASHFISLPNISQNLEGFNVRQLDFSKNPDSLRTVHSMELNSVVGTSSNADILVELMKMVDYKKFNLSTAQMSANLSRGKMKQTDIRNIFKQQSFSQATGTDESDAKLDPAYELFISSTLNKSSQDCSICVYFDMDIPMKKDLAQIPLFNKNLNNSQVINKQNLLNYLQTCVDGKTAYSQISSTPHISSSELEIQDEHETLHLGPDLASVFNEPMQLNDNDERKGNQAEEIWQNTTLDLQSDAITETSHVQKDNAEFNDSDDMFDDCNVEENLEEMHDVESVSKVTSVLKTRDDNAKRKSMSDDNEDTTNCYRRDSLEAMNPRKMRKLSISDVFQETLLMPVERDEGNCSHHHKDVSATAEQPNAPVQSLSLCDIFEGSLFEPQFENKLDIAPKRQELIATNSKNISESMQEQKEEIGPCNKNANSKDISSKSLLNELDELKIDDVFDWKLCGDFHETSNIIEPKPLSETNNDVTILSSGSESPILSNWRTTVQKSKDKVISPEEPMSQSQYSPVVRATRKTNRRFNNLDSTDLDGTSSRPLKEGKRNMTQTNKLSLKKFAKCKNSNNEGATTSKARKSTYKKQNIGNARIFLDSQVEISSDELVSSDENLIETDDEYDVSFVDDEALDDTNLTQMKAVYLQSVRSPVKKKSLPSVKRPVQDTILDHSEEESYIRDSFCVDSDVEIESSQASRISELEKAEMLLEQRRRSKRKGAVSIRKKRNRILNDISDSSHSES